MVPDSAGRECPATPRLHHCRHRRSSAASRVRFLKLVSDSFIAHLFQCVADDGREDFTGILGEHPAGGGKQFRIGGSECGEIGDMPPHALIDGGKEFEVNEVVAIGEMDREPGTELSGSQALQETLGQAGKHLIGGSGIEPVFIEIVFPCHSVRG